jgi:hypothetical protein
MIGTSSGIGVKVGEAVGVGVSTTGVLVGVDVGNGVAVGPSGDDDALSWLSKPQPLSVVEITRRPTPAMKDRNTRLDFKMDMVLILH